MLSILSVSLNPDNLELCNRKITSLIEISLISLINVVGLVAGMLNSLGTNKLKDKTYLPRLFCFVSMTLSFWFYLDLFH